MKSTETEVNRAPRNRARTSSYAAAPQMRGQVINGATHPSTIDTARQMHMGVKDAVFYEGPLSEPWYQGPLGRVL